MFRPPLNEIPTEMRILLHCIHFWATKNTDDRLKSINVSNAIQLLETSYLVGIKYISCHDIIISPNTEIQAKVFGS